MCDCWKDWQVAHGKPCRDLRFSNSSFLSDSPLTCPISGSRSQSLDKGKLDWVPSSLFSENSPVPTATIWVIVDRKLTATQFVPRLKTYTARTALKLCFSRIGSSEWMFYIYWTHPVFILTLFKGRDNTSCRNENCKYSKLRQIVVFAPEAFVGKSKMSKYYHRAYLNLRLWRVFRGS